MPSEPYHHGALREALLQAALEAIEERGPAALSLRDVARRVGVSHAASAHHFGDKAGLLTEIAIEGQELLADAMARAFASTGGASTGGASTGGASTGGASTGGEATGGFLEMGVAYVRVAVEHRAHFEVVYRPDLYHADDPRMADAQRRTGEIFSAGLATLTPAQAGPDPAVAGLAAWSIVHGLAVLWLNGLVTSDVGGDVEQVARSVASLLFRG